MAKGLMFSSQELLYVDFLSTSIINLNVDMAVMPIVFPTLVQIEEIPHLSLNRQKRSKQT